MLSMLSLLPLLLLSTHPLPTHSKSGTVSYDTLASFDFLTRFVFVPTPTNTGVSGDGKDLQFIKDNYGMIEFSVDYAAGTHPSLLLYYEGFDGWTTVNDPSSRYNCSARYERASTKVDLTAESSAVREITTNSVKWDGRETMRASGYLYFKSSRPQWFFVALSNCHPPSKFGDVANALRCADRGYCQGPLLARVDYNTTNGSGRYSKHFSYDELGVRELYITFLFLQTLLVVEVLYIRRLCLTVNKYHLTVQVLMWSVIVAWVSHLTSMIYYEMYAATGLANYKGPSVASFLFNASDLLVVYLLIFLAKGWTLVRYKISCGGRIKISILITVTMFATIALDSWKSYGFDASQVVYFYASPPGKIVVWLRVFTLAWFVYCCWTTVKSFDTKRRFYTRFSAIFSIFLGMKPLMVAVCGTALDDNNRFKFLQFWEVSQLFLGQLLLCLMYHPRASFNKGFPFHSVSSVMLGLVQGQSASDFLREAATRDAVEDVERTGLAQAINEGVPQVWNGLADSGRGNVIDLRRAKDTLKGAGIGLHRTLLDLSDASEDLINRLRDLDDYDGDDVDFRREASPQQGGRGGGGDMSSYEDLE